MLRRQQLSVFTNVACIDFGLAQISLSQLPWPLTLLIVPLIEEHFAVTKNNLRLLRAAHRRFSHFAVSLLFTAATCF